MLVLPGEKRGGLYSQVGQDAVKSSRRCRLTALLTARWEIDTARQRELARRCQGDALLAAQRPGCPPAAGPLPLLCSTAIKPKPAPYTRRHGLEIKYLINYSGVRSFLISGLETSQFVCAVSSSSSPMLSADSIMSLVSEIRISTNNKPEVLTGLLHGLCEERMKSS